MSHDHTTASHPGQHSESLSQKINKTTTKSNKKTTNGGHLIFKWNVQNQNACFPKIMRNINI